jgi:phosphohistidine phosphatase
MKLLLVRHAIALDRGTPGIADGLRPLTEEGIAKFKKTAKGLSQLVKADLVLTSPLLRAKQTAEILARQWPGVAVHESAPLESGSRARFEDSLRRISQSTVIAAVGHEPSVSEWTAEWLGSESADSFAFKKGGAALLEFDGEAAEGSARLVFFLAPGAIKDLQE